MSRNNGYIDIVNLFHGINIQNNSITGNYTNMPVHKSIILCIIAEADFIKPKTGYKHLWG